MNNSDLNVLFDAIKLVESKVYRDFCEIENLQNSHTSAIVFTKKTLEFLDNKFFDFFSKKRENYNIVIKGINTKIDKSKTRTIYINSLSGILNFSHAIPYFCTSITVKENIDGKETVLCGIVNNYATQDLFFVERNKGCFLKGRFNDIRLRISNRANLESSIVSIKYDAKKDRFKKILDKVGAFKINNCAILDIVNLSSGRYDASFLYDKNIFELDLGILFVKEAGGNIEYSDNKNDIILSNSLLYIELKKLI